MTDNNKSNHDKLTSSAARTGRELQRYSPAGERMIVGVVPITKEVPPRILLINSRSHPEEWLLPKGGWDSDETRGECAVREAWEEAGVLGKLIGLGGGRRREEDQEKDNDDDDDPHPLLFDFSAKGKNHDQLQTYFALEIEEMKDEWPEKDERGRKLFSIDDAEVTLRAQERRKDRLAQCAAIENLKECTSLPPTNHQLVSGCKSSQLN